LFHGVEYQRVPQEIIPELLWLGPKAAASDIRELQALGITDIIIASATITPRFPGCFNYKKIAVDDVPSADIATFFEDCIVFLEAASQSNRRVLVHCNQGVSRSATLVAAYIMKSQKKTAKEALDFIKTRRYVANPNSGFRLQLSAFERRILHADCLIPPENSYIATATTSERGEI
jgi:atypical dual specificity phosphatase